jgi:hypothetical protein
MRSLLRSRTFLIAAAILFLIIGILMVHPIYSEMCEQTASGQKHNCAPQHIGLIAIRKIGQAFSDGNFINGFITAIATAFIAWFTLTLRRSTDRLWDASERQLGHLEETAKKELRAYIVTQVRDLTWPDNWKGVAKIIIGIKNTGQTPAYDLRTLSRTRLYDYPFPPDFDFTLISGEDPSVGLLGPGEDTETGADSEPLSGDDWLEIRHGDENRRLCTYGTVTYRDAFGDKQYTNFCVSHVFEITPLPGGEKIAIVSRTAARHNDAS